MAQSEQSGTVVAEPVRKFNLEHFAFIGLIVFSLIGIAMTNLSPIISFWYWLAMVPVFAGAAVVTEWTQARHLGDTVTHVIKIQIAHWSGVVIALLATHTLWANGRLQNEDTGLVILLTLAVATYLDGPHCGWRFYLAGSFLFLIAVVAAHIKYFVWFVILLAVPIVLLGIYLDEHHLVPTIRGSRKLEKAADYAAPRAPATSEAGESVAARSEDQGC